MLMCLSILVPLWIESGYGLLLDSYLDHCGRQCPTPFMVTHFCWADNVWLVAKDYLSLTKMITSFGNLLNEKKLYWKPSSLMIMTTADTPEIVTSIPTMDKNRQPVDIEIPMVVEMEVLGTMLHRTGCSTCPLA